MDPVVDPMIPDARPPIPVPGFPRTRRDGYDPLSVDRWVAEAAVRIDELTGLLKAAHLRASAAGSEARADAVEDRRASAVLDRALKAVLEQAGTATDGVLNEARAHAVAFVAVAQRQAELVIADAEVKADQLLAQRRIEVDVALAERTQQLRVLSAEIEVMRAARRVALGVARSSAEQLAAAAKALQPQKPRAVPVLLDLTDGQKPPTVVDRAELTG
jgi:hypothetical protein